MTQIGESISPPQPEPQPEKPKNKKPFSIRFALYFDGTLNNRANIAEREKAELGGESRPYLREGDGGNNSYDNGRTNIALLYEQSLQQSTNKSETGYDYSFSWYIEGQGTFDQKGDSTMGYAFGSWDSGVYARARLGINRAMEKLGEWFEEWPPEENYIEKLHIDVFGFSRGAATARHCIHVMTNTNYDEASGYALPLHDRIRLLGYSEFTEKHLEVVFAGIYDTVVSVNASQYLPAWLGNNTRNQRAIEKAKKAYHLAAAEEHRLDFPLHLIKSAKTRGTGFEYFLPGVHSDVGGSYNLANALLIKDQQSDANIYTVLDTGSYREMKEKQEKLVAAGAYPADRLSIQTTHTGRGGTPLAGKLLYQRQIQGVEYMRTSSEVDRVIHRGSYQDVLTDKQNLLAAGWYREDEMQVKPTGWARNGMPIAAELIVNRKNIKSAYSNIPLKLMAEYARENGIKLKPRLEEEANKILEPETELQQLEQYIRAYIARVGNNSKPEDWLNHQDIGWLRHDHLHMSCKVAIGYHPRIKNAKRVRYYYEA